MLQTPPKQARKQDVAQACGVNLTTVTLALNNHPRVAERTRRRIQAEAHRLGYLPNHAARQLVRQRYRCPSMERVGLVLFGPHQPLRGPYLAIMAGVEQEVTDKGGTLLFMRETSERPRARFVELSGSGAVDGLTLVGDIDDKALLQVKQVGQPFVVIGDYHGTTPVHQATADFFAMGRLAVQHLVEQGHRRIGFLGATMRFVYQRDIRDGVKRGLAEAGLPVVDELFQTREGFEDYALAVPVRNLLAVRTKPTAVVFGEPGRLPDLLTLLKQHGVKTPDDISLVTCESSDARLVADGVTHVDVSLMEVGAAGAALLREVAAEPGGPVRRVLTAPRLVEGGSVRKPIER